MWLPIMLPAILKDLTWVLAVKILCLLEFYSSQDISDEIQVGPSFVRRAPCTLSDFSMQAPFRFRRSVVPLQFDPGLQ